MLGTSENIRLDMVPALKGTPIFWRREIQIQAVLEPGRLWQTHQENYEQNISN